MSDSPSELAGEAFIEITPPEETPTDEE